MEWFKNYKKHWLILLALALINSFYVQRVNSRQVGSYIFEIAVGVITMTLIFLIVGLLFFGIARLFKKIDFKRYLQICIGMGIVLTALFLLSYFNIRLIDLI